jgi:hypothetical protein
LDFLVGCNHSRGAANRRSWSGHRAIDADDLA